MPDLHDVWRQRMATLLAHCRASLPGEQAHLQRDTPIKDGNSRSLYGDRDFEGLLASSAYECAALVVIGARSEFNMAKGVIRPFAATVRLPGRSAFGGEGRTIALALLSAWAAAC